MEHYFEERSLPLGSLSGRRPLPQRPLFSPMDSIKFRLSLTPQKGQFELKPDTVSQQICLGCICTGQEGMTSLMFRNDASEAVNVEFNLEKGKVFQVDSNLPIEGSASQWIPITCFSNESGDFEDVLHVVFGTETIDLNISVSFVIPTWQIQSETLDFGLVRYNWEYEKHVQVWNESDTVLQLDVCVSSDYELEKTQMILKGGEQLPLKIVFKPMSSESNKLKHERHTGCLTVLDQYGVAKHIQLHAECGFERIVMNKSMRNPLKLNSEVVGNVRLLNAGYVPVHGCIECKDVEVVPKQVDLIPGKEICLNVSSGEFIGETVVWIHLGHVRHRFGVIVE